MSGSPSPSRRGGGGGPAIVDAGGGVGAYQQPRTVGPQQVSDPTMLESVAGFINEVVPTGTAGNAPPRDPRDQIQWVRFEQIEPEEDEEFLSSYDYEKVTATTVVLVFGYASGVQVWAVPPNGEAVEILSWKHGTIKVLKFLPNPYIAGDFAKADVFKSKRPLVAVCDSSSTNPPFSSLGFISLRTGDQEKVIKFKNPIIDVLANKRSVVVTFQEKIAVFDAFTLEDRLTVTTCYLSPGLNPNPVALGSRWMAYAEKKLNPSKRSSGGSEGEGVQSYTATVLHAAKSLGRGLRELGESVASSLTGNSTFKPGTSPNSPQAGGIADVVQKGIVTVLDIECPTAAPQDKSALAGDPVVAHFTATTEAVVHLAFDPSGMLLLTVDKRGHDFNLFRIQPHPGGPVLAAVHHLYVLHRGDTSARVQDICFSPDSRWVVVSTLRGTSHVFPITTYGGNVGVRTHATPHVVNKMSRFHRSAGLTADGRSNSPVSMLEAPSTSHFPYHNPRFPPYPHPTVIHPLAQIRQPLFVQNVMNAQQRPHTGRQRLSSSSEENIALKVAACFAPPRAWIDNPPRETTLNKQVRPVESLFVASSHGMLIQYDLEPHQASNVPKEKVCGETPIELTVCGKAEWVLQRMPGYADQPPPISSNFFGYVSQDVSLYKKNKPDDNDDQWLSQVEIITHAGPHRRLWMGPQFTFKTYTTSGSPMSMAEAQPLDLGQTNPVNVPVTKSSAILIESGSANSCEHFLLDTYHKTFVESSGGESQLKEDLADAMLESPGIRETGGRCVIVQMKPAVAKVVNPLGTVVNVHSEEDSDQEAAISEESIIHENCDETLFRPVVTPKTTACHEMNRRYADNIMTKSLQPNTEVAVSILKREDSKLTKASPKSTKVKRKDSTSSRDKEKIGKPKKGPEVKPKIEKLIDMPDTESIDTSFSTFDPPCLDNEDFFSLETRSEKFEDCSEEQTYATVKKKNRTRIEKREQTDDTYDPPPPSTEPVLEEKPVVKNQRKPRSKLGVKIININTENSKKIEEDVIEVIPAASRKSWSSIAASKSAADTINDTIKKIPDVSAEIILPVRPTKSWSTIAASKCEAEKPLLDSEDKENDLDLDLPKIEFTMYLPTKKEDTYVTQDLIDINTPQEEKVKDAELSESTSLIKIDKSSDDEKVDSGSSHAETTESDDSGKVPPEVASEDIIAEVTEKPMSRAARRKKRKK